MKAKPPPFYSVGIHNRRYLESKRRHAPHMHRTALRAAAEAQG